MSTEARRRRRFRAALALQGSRSMARGVMSGFMVLTSVLIAACGGSEPSPESGASASGQAPAAAASASPVAEPASVADLFPPGAGRDMVMNTCGSCHAVACSTIGQRSAARWNSLKEGHRDRLQNTSTADLDAIFGYLATHFNDTTPEPKVPPRFLEGGCTPF